MAKIVDYTIVMPQNPTENERRAATFLRENIRLVCGKKVPLVTDDAAPVDLEIVVGETNREALTGFSIRRWREEKRNGAWEHVVQKVGTRLFLSSRSYPPEEAPFESSYRTLNDGKIGTVMAANHFVEKILGYEFINGMYWEFPENPDLEMPEEYNYQFTRERLREEDPVLFDGAAMYVLPIAENLNWNLSCIIIKTRQNKLIVIDGGHNPETDRVLRILQRISCKDVPHVDAWLFSHMHADHYGVYDALVSEEKYKGKITVDTFYCNLMDEKFYTEIARDKNPIYGVVRQELLDSEKAIGTKVRTVYKGDKICVDEVEFEVLHAPLAEDRDKMNMNDSSVVYKMTYDGSQTMMLLGDAEWVCNKHLMEEPEKLKSDIVQVGHHGCGNVSRACYEAIDAKVYIWQVCKKFWYSDCSESTNSHNTGVTRTRYYMMGLNPKQENVYPVFDNILSTPLPMEIY